MNLVFDSKEFPEEKKKIDYESAQYNIFYYEPTWIFPLK